MVALSYTPAFVMRIKIVSSINGATAIHTVSGKELKKKRQERLIVLEAKYRSIIQTLEAAETADQTLLDPAAFSGFVPIFCKALPSPLLYKVKPSY